MRVDYSRVVALQAAARRERAEAIARLIVRAFVWLTSRKQVRHASRAHFAR
ncbi:MAG TPA: hypothetical protein VN929_11340 [Burkholderiales bacterium]|nr:hypothetical protein [Burkholderiales bacterium]